VSLEVDGDEIDINIYDYVGQELNKMLMKEIKIIIYIKE